MDASTGMLLASAGLGAVGLIVFAVWLRGVFRFRHLEERGVRVDGVVVSSEDAGDGARTITVEYEDHQGQRRQIRPGFASGRFPDETGATLAVVYDREQPTVARLEVAAQTTRWLLPLVTAVCLVTSAALAPLALFVVAPLDAEVDAFDRVVHAFVSEVRRGVPPGERTTTTPDAVVDEAYLAHHGPRSTGFEMQRRAVGFQDGCIEGGLLPSNTTLTLYLVYQSGTWRVARAKRDDPECDRRLAPD